MILTALQIIGGEIVTQQGSTSLERSTDPMKLMFTIDIFSFVRRNL